MFLVIDYHCMQLAINAVYFKWARELMFSINTSSRYASLRPMCVHTFLLFIIAECSKILSQ